MMFSVWAPKAQRVDLVINDQRLAMERIERGWWMLDAVEAEAGDEYAFSIDGGPPRPDPRSMDQPHGVHGPSRIINHDAYEWRIHSFRPPSLASAIIYEMHVGTFTSQGTLDAAIDRLDHLVHLGVTHVELLPLNSFDGERGWGYDGVCWFAPHRAYTGPDGPDAVKRFVDACHARGLAVLLDVVYNHLGPSGNYLAEFGPYFTEMYSTFWGPAVNLDGPGSDEVRRYICDNALMWLREYRFDGLRLDAVHAFFDRSAVHLLEELSSEVRNLEAATGRAGALIAESDLNDPRVIQPVEIGGYGIGAQWSDDFHHALHSALTGERSGYYQDFGSIAQLAKALRQSYVYDGVYSAHRDRRHGRSPAGRRADQFVVCIQNHDQIGNRAAGDRLSALVPREALELAAAMVILSPFVPLLFQGEEWGTEAPFQFFADHQDEDLAERVRQGRREEFAAFGWKPEDVPDPEDEATFMRSKLPWDEIAETEHARMLRWYRDLIALRRSGRDLAPGALEETGVDFSERDRWITAARGSIVIAFNLAQDASSIPWPKAHHQAIGNAESPIALLTNDDTATFDERHARLKPFGVLAIRIPGQNR